MKIEIKMKDEHEVEKQTNKQQKRELYFTSCYNCCLIKKIPEKKNKQNSFLYRPKNK